jgi:sugar phosphate permease
MAMQHSLLRKRRNHRRKMRFMGFMFAFVGTAIFLFGVLLALDPTATISCNGVVTTSPGCKRSFAAFGAVFAVAGFGMLFAKSRWLDTFFVWGESMRPNWPWRRR